MQKEFRKCPFCAEEIKIDAIKCKHCGEILDSDLRQKRTIELQRNLPKQRIWNPGLATVLSLVIPGVGQMYKGNILIGLLWLVIVPVGYLFLIIPGLILHLICIVLAYSGDPYKQY